MNMHHRRRFLQTSMAGGALAGLGSLGDLTFISGLGPVSAADAKLPAKAVQMRPSIEPLVRLLEQTPRDKLLEEVGHAVTKGLSYRDLLSALLLAGVRNIEPRPSVGFKFHAVLVVNAAHLASLSGPASDRWLPIFWAVDYFKGSQARDVREGDWTMAPVDESKLPKAHKAKAAFIDAMDKWDAPAADVAIAALVRTGSAHEIFELFFRYGSRDFRSIGHKAIFVSNTCRALQTIGWQHAEPVLRSLTYALMNHTGQGNPAKSDHSADRPGRENLKWADELKEDWRSGKLDNKATIDLLQALRQSSTKDVSKQIVETINSGVSPQSVWDALFASASELVMRQPSIVPLHAATATNAMHYAYQTTSDDKTRRWLILQNAAFLTLFRDAAKGRGKLPERRIDQLNEEKLQDDKDPITEIFADVGRDRSAATAKAYSYLNAAGSPKLLINAARRLIFLKGNNAHDYKYSSAVLEDYYHLSPRWRNQYLAGCTYLLKGSNRDDSSLVKRTRAALGKG